MRNYKAVIIAVIFLISCKFCTSKDDSTDFRYEDKIRIMEAVKISEAYGNSLWENWNSAPFAILLVTNENEYLIYHTSPTEDFKSAGYDSLLGSEVYIRPRQFSNNFLATFPAVSGVSTIVVGQPENTSRSSLAWIITIVHEHFHQLQSVQPDYYESVKSLDLAGDDQSGMWMLNYKFPYEDKVISDQYYTLTQSAKKAFLAESDSEFDSGFVKYLNEREKFKSMLSKKDYDYFSFQKWQEGIARYTEIKMAEILKNNYTSSREVTMLEDYITLDSFYVKSVNHLLSKADSQKLDESHRNCFYVLGALEGLILDRVNPDWRKEYFSNKFYTEKYFLE